MTKLEFLADMGMEEPGLIAYPRGLCASELQTYFTAGVKEVRAWTVKVGATAPEAARCIHTDFQKGFIRAESWAMTTLYDIQGRARRQRGRQMATGRKRVHRAGRRRYSLSLQRVIVLRKSARENTQNRVTGELTLSALFLAAQYLRAAFSWLRSSAG